VCTCLVCYYSHLLAACLGGRGKPSSTRSARSTTHTLHPPPE
jgi:hypothetical protein